MSSIAQCILGVELSFDIMRSKTFDFDENIYRE